MQPVNKPERKKAYINFMLLFLLCSAIIITTVITGASVPLKENAQLREYRKANEKKNDIRTQFSEKLNSLSGTIEVLDKTKVEYAAKTSEIDAGIGELNKLIPIEDNDDKKFYTLIATNLNLYYVAKKAVQDKTDNSAEIAQLRQDLKDAQKEAQKNHDDWVICMTKH